MSREDLKYTRDHQWVTDSETEVKLGITHFAQDALGDIVFVQLPEAGRIVKANESFAEVESSKSVSDIYAPVTGTVVEINPLVVATPGLLNSDPYGEGWLCVIAPIADADTSHLLSYEDYQVLVEGD